MPPMLEALATPWITSTSPFCARLCASNSAIRLTCWRAPSIGLMRWMMLRTVSAGPAMVRPGMVGLSTDAPMTPHGMPSSSIVSEMIPVASPSAIRRSIAPCGGRGTAISLMFSAAMRPVNRLFSATDPNAPAASASVAACILPPLQGAKKRRCVPSFGRLPPNALLGTVAAPPHMQRPIAMIDLYALTSPNVQKIYIMLEECGLPYKEHFVDVWKGEQYTPEFAKINPNNKIPAIVDQDGPGGKPYPVIESGAILIYLAEKTEKFLPKDTAKKYDVLQWLMIQLTGVGPMFGQWTHFKLFAPKGSDDYSMARYTSENKAPLRGAGDAARQRAL